MDSTVPKETLGGLLEDEYSQKRALSSFSALRSQSSLFIFIAAIGWSFFVVTVFLFSYVLYSDLNNVKTVVVKVFGDGHSIVEPYEEGAPINVWPAVLNADLTRWMVRRHREDPLTINNDYVFVDYFLGVREHNAFISQSEFNASLVIKNIQEDKSLLLRIPRVTLMRHVDAEIINVQAMTGQELIETQVFLDIEIRSRDSGLLIDQNAIEKKVVTITWRVNPLKRERSLYANDEHHLAALFENPIGIEIMSYDIDDVLESF